MPASFRPFLLLALAALAPSTLTAQVGGRVVGERGDPIASAALELWSDSARVAIILTGDDGRYVIPEGLLQRSRRVIVSLIGYESIVLTPAALGSSGPLVLSESPLRAAELRAEAQLPTCTGRDSPEARYLWNVARSRYWEPTGAVEFKARASVRRGFVSADEVGAGHSQREAFAGELVWGFQVDRIRQNIATSGYAWTKPIRERLATRVFDDDYDRWEYVALDSREAYHFATELFGVRQTFRILSADEETVKITFCPATRATGTITGVLEVSVVDTTFAHASWRFATGRPDERPEVRCYLLPRRPVVNAQLLLQRHAVPSGATRRMSACTISGALCSLPGRSRSERARDSNELPTPQRQVA
jgi:hypothetical protein